MIKQLIYILVDYYKAFGTCKYKGEYIERVTDFTEFDHLLNNDIYYQKLENIEQPTINHVINFMYTPTGREIFKTLLGKELYNDILENYVPETKPKVYTFEDRYMNQN